MKKFTKLFLSCALVSAMAVTAAASAFAEAPASVPITGKLTGTATIGESGVTITELKLPEGTQVAAKSEVTFLVFKGVTDVATDASNVEGIDQNTYSNTVVPTNNGLKSAKWVDTPVANEVTTYTVMVGYTNSENKFETVSGTFELTKKQGQEITIGDIDLQDGVDSMDATYILRKIATKPTLTGYAGTEVTNASDSTKFVIGDVDLQDGMDSMDATYILRKIATKPTLTGIVGETRTVILPEGVTAPAE